MPSQGTVKLLHNDLLSLEALADTAQALATILPIPRIRLTGGEPLVRAGLPALIALLRMIPGVREISMTTNGTLLAQHAATLKHSGLARVNVSLDSLDPDEFTQITRGGQLAATIAGIEAARHEGLAPIKINSVLRRSTFRRDLPPLLSFATEYNLELRLIELMQTGTERAWCEQEYLAASEAEAYLISEGLIPGAALSQHGPARLSSVLWRGSKLRLGWITPRSHPFCAQCNRLRLDSRGRLFRCLMDANYLPLATLLRNEGIQIATDAAQTYLSGKIPPLTMTRSYSMASIGG